MLYSTIRYAHFLSKELSDLERNLDSMCLDTMCRKPIKKEHLTKKVEECRATYQTVSKEIMNWAELIQLNPYDQEYLVDYIQGKDTKTLDNNFLRTIKRLTQNS